MVAGVLRDGVATGEFEVDDVPGHGAGPAVDGHRRRPLVRPRRAAHPGRHRDVLRRPRRAARARHRLTPCSGRGVSPRGYSDAVNNDAVRNAEGHGGSASIAIPDYWWYVARADLLEAALRSHVEGAGLALDLGSADGPSAAWFRESAQRTVSLDIDPRGLGSDGVCGSALALPFEDAAFDAVSAFDVIEHCEPEATALAEVRRVLRPGGQFVMSVPAYTWAWTDFDVANGHHRRYTTGRAVAAVERAGFTVQRATYGFATVFPMFVGGAAGPQGVPSSGRTGRSTSSRSPSCPRRSTTRCSGLSRVDRAVLARRDLPFGSSVFLAATRGRLTAVARTWAQPSSGPPDTTRARTSADVRARPGGQRASPRARRPRARPATPAAGRAPARSTAAADRDRAQRSVEHPPGLRHEVADGDRAAPTRAPWSRPCPPARRGRGRCCARPSARRHRRTGSRGWCPSRRRPAAAGRSRRRGRAGRAAPAACRGSGRGRRRWRAGRAPRARRWRRERGARHPPSRAWPGRRRRAGGARCARRTAPARSRRTGRRPTTRGRRRRPHPASTDAVSAPVTRSKTRTSAARASSPVATTPAPAHQASAHGRPARAAANRATSSVRAAHAGLLVGPGHRAS